MFGKPVIVGAGPAGLFAGLVFVNNGIKPIIIEQGKKVEERKKDVEEFLKTGKLKTSSNVQFGEGGAGTFSDGKLNTRVSDKFNRINFVLNTFIKFGAPKEILYSYNPHIGTDVLIDVIRNMRKEIINLGGTFMFNENSDQGLLKTGTISDFTNTCGNYQILNAVFELAQPTCASGQYLPANTTSCVACPNGYTCAGGTFTFDANIDQGIVGNTITVIWNGATAEDIAANNAGTVTYGGDIRTPVRPDPSQIPIGKRFVGWTFRKPVQN